MSSRAFSHPSPNRSLAVAFCAALAGATPVLAQEAGPTPPPVGAQLAAAPPGTASSDEAATLAKKLSNPVAALISVPFQSNIDGAIGPLRDGTRFTLNIQPVVPITLSDSWNLISRTVVPVIWQSNVAPGSGSQTGLGDTVQSLFFSPSKASKVIWGVGPAILAPTGTDSLLSTGKWAVGPTGVALVQSKGWTAGVLANQLWSFAGSSARDPVNSLFVNPFLNYTTRKATTYGIQAEATYNWYTNKLSMPLTATIGQVAKVGEQLMSFTIGVRYWAATGEYTPHGVGGRLTVVLLYPRR